MKDIALTSGKESKINQCNCCQEKGAQMAFNQMHI